jgi:hypothetical protein
MQERNRTSRAGGGLSTFSVRFNILNIQFGPYWSKKIAGYWMSVGVTKPRPVSKTQLVKFDLELVFGKF